MDNSNWRFSDPPNVAVFTDKRIMDGSTWIYYASHDLDDGAWQFHGPDGFADESNAMIVGLKQIVALDPSINELADLPLNWCAWRDTPNSPWQRCENEG